MLSQTHLALFHPKPMGSRDSKPLLRSMASINNRYPASDPRRELNMLEAFAHKQSRFLCREGTPRGTHMHMWGQFCGILYRASIVSRLQWFWSLPRLLGSKSRLRRFAVLPGNRCQIANKQSYNQAAKQQVGNISANNLFTRPGSLTSQT